MTINELIKKLQELPLEDRESQVIMAKDAEGNGYSSVSGVSGGGYCLDSGASYIEGLYLDEWGFEGNGFETEGEWEKFRKKCDRVVVISAN